MRNYICVGSSKIELTDEQVKEIVAAYDNERVQLGTIQPGETIHIGPHEMVVLEHIGDTTALIKKELLPDAQFGTNNNYAGSYVDDTCEAFADEIAAVVGRDYMLSFSVDLTSNDGLKDYGCVDRYASLLTSDQFRRYVALLDQHNPELWWWLATAHSTPTHGSDRWVKCVSPSGYVSFLGYDYDGIGVRPFCILKSYIFVSK